MATKTHFPENVSRSELARLFNKDERTITNYAQEGMPRRVRGKSVSYPVIQCIEWLLERERQAVRAGKGLNELDMARARKAQADAQLAESKLAELSGELIRVELHLQRIREICDRLRNVLITVPSRFLSRILATTSDVEAQAVGEQIRDETLTALQETARDIVDPPADEEPQEIQVLSA